MFNKPEIKAYTIVTERIAMQPDGSFQGPEADE